MRFTILVAVVVLSAGVISGVHAQQKIAGTTPGATISHAYGSSDFRLGPEDVIEVSVYQDKDFSTTLPVRPDGKISLHLIGEIVASGKTTKELQKEIAEKVAQFIPNPSVTVSVKEVNSPKVSVLGEVKSPGMYKIKDRATILDAVALAGGLTEFAKKDKVTVFRVDPNGDQRPIKINLNDQIKGRRAEPFYVLPYDKIYIQ